jgi:hypothetical protein
MVADVTRAARDEVLLELTRSICPNCKQVLDAELNARDNRVFLRKRCPEHGEFEALAYGDAERYREIQRHNKPGDRPLELQTEVVDGCPHDCGICPEHRQHSCLGIIEVNTGCNLDCPICFAESGTGHQPDGFSLTLGQVESGGDHAFGSGELAKKKNQICKASTAATTLITTTRSTALTPCFSRMKSSLSPRMLRSQGEVRRADCGRPVSSS